MRILHIVDSLSVNGRTILLQELVRYADPSVEHLIVTLLNTGTLTTRFTQLGIEAHALNLYRPLRNIRQLAGGIIKISRFKPDVCLCWSGDANIVSTVPRLFGIPVIWTIHNSTVHWSTRKTRYGIRLAAFLSRTVPRIIICCSNKTYEVYRDIHRYKPDKLIVITNGVDTTKYRPSNIDRQSVRKELGISDKTLVVSTAARIEQAGRQGQGDFKDLETLFRTAALVCHQRPDTVFLLFGLNLNYDNEELADWIDKYDVRKNIKLLGFQNNVAGLFAASDIYAMSSTSGEGLPIALLEAMASGAIPVCTDSGDIAAVVGAAGFIAKQKDANALASAILRIADFSEEERASYSARSLEIVNKSYSIENVAKRYMGVLVESMQKASSSGK